MPDKGRNCEKITLAGMLAKLKMSATLERKEGAT
jgi:hypothetical protein